ncbi:O-antigen ligase family protein [Candidatus Cloacimonadota bacterium]
MKINSLRKVSFRNVSFRNFPVLIFSFLTYFILPLLYTKMAVDPLLTVRYLLKLFILTTSYFVLLFFWKNLNFKGLKSPQTLIILLFTITTLVSGISAINKAEYFYSLSKDCSNLLFYILIIILLKKNLESTNLLIKTIIVSSIFFSFIGIGQFFFGWFLSIPGYESYYSTFANRNLLSSICFLVSPFILYGYFRLNRIWKVLCIIAIIQITFTISIIMARAVFLAVFLATYVLVLIIIFLKLRFSRSLSKTFRILIIIVILTSIISVGISKTEFFKEKHPKISRKNLGTDSSIFVRIYAWKKTWAMIQDQPFTGVGAGNWKIILPKYKIEGKRLESGAYQYIRPHNDYLWVWAENGILGFIFYLLIFIIALRQAIKLLKTEKQDKLLIILMIFGLIGYMVIAFFSFPRERVYHSIILFTYISIISNLHSKRSSKQIRSENSRNSIYVRFSILLVALLLSAIFLSYTLKRMKSEVHFFFAHNARLVNNFKLTIAAIDKIDPHIYNISPTGIPIQWYRGNAYFQRGDVEEAYKDFLGAYKTHPYHFFNLNNLGTCYEIYGNHNKAITYYNKVLDISPNYCETLINLSAVYYNQQKYLTAFKIISRCSPDKENRKYSFYYDTIMEKLKSLEFDEEDIYEN